MTAPAGTRRACSRARARGRRDGLRHRIPQLARRRSTASPRAQAAWSSWAYGLHRLTWRRAGTCASCGLPVRRYRALEVGERLDLLEPCGQARAERFAQAEARPL